MNDKNNEFVRMDSSVTINGNKLNLKPKDKSIIELFGKTKLYDYLIKSK